MFQLLDFGYDILNSIQDLGSWLISPIPSETLRVFNLLSPIDIAVGTTFSEMLFGTGLVVILILKLIGFLIGTLTG